jgi:hypothetical protein
LFQDLNTKDEFVKFMTISEREVYLATHPNIQQLLNGATPIHSGRGMKKPDSGFRDILSRIKEKHSRGITKSNINTF